MEQNVIPKVSVIVPVYNVEPFVERCAHSLFGQTLDSLEYIFVDDCSPDNSIAIIKQVLDQYPNRKSQARFLRHEFNQGQAGARTTGMKSATGEYMIHLDPDDWVDLDMYESLYNAAHPADRLPIDIVCCDYLLHKNQEVYPTSLKVYSTPNDCLKYLYKPHSSCLFLTNKLVSSSLIKNNNIYPLPGIDFGEDRNMTIRIFHHANSIVKVPKAFYHYNKDNNNSITRSNPSLELWNKWKKNVDYISEYLLNLSQSYRITCNYFKFDAKVKFKNLFEDKKEWFYLYRECHKDIIYFSENSLKSRIILTFILSNYFIYRLYLLFKQLFKSI